MCGAHRHKHDMNCTKKSNVLLPAMFNNAKCCFVGEELLYVGKKKDLRKKVIIEVEEISEILHQYHSNPMGGHSGINNTLGKISQYYVWNGMKEDVVEYVSDSNRTDLLLKAFPNHVVLFLIIMYFVHSVSRVIAANAMRN